MIILGTNSIKDTGYDVANSCRFDDGDNAYMHKSQGGGNRRTFTLSCWFKRGNLGTEVGLFDVNNATQPYSNIRISSSDFLKVDDYDGSQDTMLITNRKFRDPSAWYHLCVAYDTTQSTASNRIKVYINGTQETSFSTETYPAQNFDTAWNNSGETLRVGDFAGNGWDGYMAEVVMIDGQQLAPTSFGEFDSDSPTIWKPIDVSGLTFGTNGFYLDFEDSSNLGNDVNGGTDFTEVNLAATDQSTDTCTNNFATMNPLNIDVSKSYTFSEGNLNISLPENAPSLATIGVSSGKWYAEVKFINNTGWHGVAPIDSAISSNTGVIQWYTGNGLYVSGSSTATWGSSLSNNDIMGVALDMDNSRVTISQNGNWWGGSSYNQSQPNTYQSLVAGYDTYTFYGNSGNGTSSVSFNFGSPSFSISSGNSDGNGYGNFEYSVPSGYYALNTKNLAEYG